ncbi:hypothetical protein ACFQVC_07435 [Streptomyces monticola]|uniref:Uncharacterized protein n=1 Tax=Streptomyces monticola TaxID=2666263 RepID=A0ABW2JEY8_9ACTN
MTSARTDAALRERAMTVLQGDRVAHLQPVVSHSQMRRTPRRLRPRPRVLANGGRPAPLSAGQRTAAGLVGFFSWVTAPLDFLGDLLLMPFRGLAWLCRSKEKRRREKHLNGGWGSAAGGLAAAASVRGGRVLAVGERQVSLVYAGEYEAETGWSVPRDQLAGVEHADWDTHHEQRATLRFHFRDGSWCDVIAQGGGWRALVDAR